MYSACKNVDINIHIGSKFYVVSVNAGLSGSLDLNSISHSCCISIKCCRRKGILHLTFRYLHSSSSNKRGLRMYFASDLYTSSGSTSIYSGRGLIVYFAAEL